jgi:serine/threonine protein kinase
MIDMTSLPIMGPVFIKLVVKRNGDPRKGYPIEVPETSTIADLLRKAGKVLKLHSPSLAFFQDGTLVQNVSSIEKGELISISEGEPFSRGAGASGAGIVGAYNLVEKLGEGGYGLVMKAVLMSTQEIRAMKLITKSRFRHIGDLQMIFNEMQTLRNLQHPNVIQLFEVVDTQDHICLVMEYASGGELKKLVEGATYLNEDAARNLFSQIARGVLYCHTKNVVHRDLKLENILVDGDRRIKIADFGLADFVSTTEKTVTDAGTFAYLAPEVYRRTSGESDPFKIDVWALGVILYAMTQGSLPFNQPDSAACEMITREGLKFRPDTTPAIKALIYRMLTVSPSDRIAMSAITTDPWFTLHRFVRYGSDLSGTG